MFTLLRTLTVTITLATVCAAPSEAGGFRVFGGRLSPLRPRCEPRIFECVPGGLLDCRDG